MGNFTKREQIVILILVIGIIIIVGYNIFDKDHIEVISNEATVDGQNDDIEKQEGLIEGRTEVAEEVVIMIHISGEVHKPGLIVLKKGDRVIDGVNQAGGLKTTADINRINLAKKVSDEEKIYIPKIGETIENDYISNSEQQDGKPSDGKIDINTATRDELINLPGIGETLAQRIIDYRQNSKFNTIDDIIKVSGIGEKKFEDMKDLITTR